MLSQFDSPAHVNTYRGAKDPSTFKRSTPSEAVIKVALHVKAKRLQEAAIFLFCPEGFGGATAEVEHERVVFVQPAGVPTRFEWKAVAFKIKNIKCFLTCRETDVLMVHCM